MCLESEELSRSAYYHVDKSSVVCVPMENVVILNLFAYVRAENEVF